MLKLRKEEKETLLGPTVIGAIFGALVFFAVYGFVSEYDDKSRGIASTILESLTISLIVWFSIVFIFGALPIIVDRLNASNK